VFICDFRIFHFSSLLRSSVDTIFFFRRQSSLHPERLPLGELTPKIGYLRAEEAFRCRKASGGDERIADTRHGCREISSASCLHGFPLARSEEK
jgi:hypothetical protein